MNNKKFEPWRVALFTISVAYIVFMWVKKDITAIYTTMPKEQTVPLIITTVAVSLLKVFLLAVAILLIKRIIEKIKETKSK